MELFWAIAGIGVFFFLFFTGLGLGFYFEERGKHFKKK